jgi:SAM-dependent methyltransferase
MADVHDRIRDFWNRDSDTYDHAPSHAVSDPVEAAVWRAALLDSLPEPPATVLDVGAGTGAMTLLAAQLGYEVTALDISAGMLERARLKAEQRGLDVEFVVGASHEPPPGPFDAVMERHVLWTTPDPVGAMRAWRESAPEGRLVSFEGAWARSGPIRKARDSAAEFVTRLYRIPPHHHAEYDPDVLEILPLAGMASPAPLIDAVAQAGWRAIRVRRLRDVEWARRSIAPPIIGWLESVPLFALAADA